MAAATYEPRVAEGTVLHRIVRDHLESFLREAADRTDGSSLPRFIEREFREFLGCGVLARGFARVRCGDCTYERLVPFSCKRRGFCPSCGGRRMAAQAAHLVDHVFPHVPVRQWVLTLPHRVRYLLAWNHPLCRALLGVHIRAVLAFYRRRARRAGVRSGQSGAVTVIQRFGGGLQLNVHFHTLALDGVFAEDGAGGLVFHPAAPPTDEEVARLVATIRTRIRRLLVRRGLDAGAGVDVDPLAEESLALAGISAAAVQGRVALGPRAGARVLQLGREPDAPWITSRGPREAHLEGFDLHAAIAVPADDRPGLERLCRYVLRPPAAQDRLHLTPEGQILVTLKAEWADGTTHLLFEPVELLEKLAALTPRPRINLVVYHGILAPHARDRARAVAHGGLARAAAQEGGGATPEPSATMATCKPAAPVVATPVATITDDTEGASPAQATAENKRNWTWAGLMQRVFALDVLCCPRCGGRMSVIATIEAAKVVQKILGHLDLPTAPPKPQPGRPPPGIPDLFPDDLA